MDRNSTNDFRSFAAHGRQIRELTEAELDAVCGGSPTGGSYTGGRAFEIRDWSFGVTNTSTIGSP